MTEIQLSNVSNFFNWRPFDYYKLKKREAPPAQRKIFLIQKYNVVTFRAI